MSGQLYAFGGQRFGRAYYRAGSVFIDGTARLPVCRHHVFNDPSVVVYGAGRASARLHVLAKSMGAVGGGIVGVCRLVTGSFGLFIYWL